MLIVLEGLDGAGKSTQLNLLSNYFKSLGKEVKFLHFPRFDTPIYGDLIARFLRGELGPIESVNPYLVALIYAHDRREAVPLLNQWLGNGEIVILDRYLFSNIAFQCAKVDDITDRKELREWIYNLEINQHMLPLPDLNIFLDVPITFVESKLNSEREGEERDYLNGKKDIHESSITFQERVREAYIEEARIGAVQMIDCCDRDGSMLVPEKIFEKILELINNKG